MAVAPTSNSTAIIGVSHHHFFCQKNVSSLPATVGWPVLSRNGMAAPPYLDFSSWIMSSRSEYLFLVELGTRDERNCHAKENCSGGSNLGTYGVLPSTQNPLASLNDFLGKISQTGDRVILRLPEPRNRNLDATVFSFVVSASVHIIRADAPALPVFDRVPLNRLVR